MFTYFNITSKHAVKREARPQQTKNEFCLDWNDFRFICEGVNSTRDYKNNNLKKKKKKKKKKNNNMPDIMWSKLSVTNVLPFEHQQNQSISWQLFETYGVINYGRGCSKDVVNECFGFYAPLRTGITRRKEMRRTACGTLQYILIRRRAVN